jgi:hypothetical protein
VETINPFSPYDRSEYFLYCSFKYWVPPPPNLLPIIDEENEEATTHRVGNPSLCKCGYQSQLTNPPNGLDYTPFWCCPISLLVILRKIISIFVISFLSM